MTDDRKYAEALHRMMDELLGQYGRYRNAKGKEPAMNFGEYLALELAAPRSLAWALEEWHTARMTC
jgi:hypothetical protein